MAKFSVILPLKNSGNYLDECVNSILAQTFIDFELLILAHDSDKATLDYLYNIKDERVKVIYAQNIDGIAGNWARIKEIPKSEYMTIIGYDDMFDPDFLETINSLIEKYPDATLYQSHFRFINAKNEVIRKCKPVPETLSPAEVLEYYVGLKADLMATGFVMRSIDYEKTGGIPLYTNLLFADLELIIELAKTGYMAVAQKECFSYRVHNAATTSSTSIGKYFEGFKSFADYLTKLKDKSPDLSGSIKSAAPVFLDKTGQNIISKILHKSKGTPGVPELNNVLHILRMYGKLLGSGETFEPLTNRKIRIAGMIYQNSILHKTFIAARKIYKKPIFK